VGSVYNSLTILDKTAPNHNLTVRPVYTFPRSGASETAFNALRDAVRIPLYGCDCYAYGLLAAGHCDLVAESDLKPYDYLAMVPIIEGAGGRITDWRGRELVWPVREAADAKRFTGEVLAAGDAECHAAALQLLNWQG
jgi:inositol-phosphate phosphatase/L-galactose 1-phosphate phosphatase/histidinol-phosphatase